MITIIINNSNNGEIKNNINSNNLMKISNNGKNKNK